MSVDRNEQMQSQEIFSKEKILTLLRQGHVINLVQGTKAPGTWKKTRSQYRIDDGNIVLIRFDSFDQRRKPVIVSKKNLMEACDRWTASNEKDWCTVDSFFFTSHKKRVPARIKNPKVIDEHVSKCHLYSYLIEKYPESTIIPEFTLSTRRADFVVFTREAIHIYEIKSENDNLSRLDAQIAEYRKFGSTVTLVIHPNKVKKIPDDKFLGLMLLLQEGVEHKRKPALLKPKTKNLQHLIWLKEADKVFQGVKGKSKLDGKIGVMNKLRRLLNEDRTRKYLCTLLMERYLDEHNLRIQLKEDEGVDAAVSKKRIFDDNVQVKGLALREFLKRTGDEGLLDNFSLIDG